MQILNYFLLLHGWLLTYTGAKFSQFSPISAFKSLTAPKGVKRYFVLRKFNVAVVLGVKLHFEV